jgi:hypothetical protein
MWAQWKAYVRRLYSSADKNIKEPEIIRRM